MKLIKQLSFAIILLMGFHALKAQNEYPKSVISASAGVGPNYGVFGVKTVFGYKNSGLLLSMGRLEGQLTYTIGAQWAVDWWYLSAGYGTYGYYKWDFGNEEGEELMKGMIVMTGAMINLGKAKRFFIDTGIGYSFGYAPPSTPPFGDPGNEGTISITLGIGYRIGTW